MKVLVAGATGAIGRPLIAALTAARHEVVGMTSHAAGAQLLRDQRADAVVVNALDGAAVEREVTRIRPDAIVDELTSLPKRYTPEEMRLAAPRDRQIRLEGGENLYRSALKAGVKRYVVQSTGFFYGPGQGLASETEALALNASPAIAASVATYTEIEKRVFRDPAIRAVALRYGFFYGPHTYHDPTTGSISEQVRNREYPVIDPGTGIFSFIHTEDAAAATVAALEARPGVYNVVDDDPVAMNVWLPAFARFLGAPPPPHISEQQALDAHGPDAAYYAIRLRGASNSKAKEEFQFSPRPLEWLAVMGARRTA
jgi:nucleoside-diphosphate-sugar epimerase